MSGTGYVPIAIRPGLAGRDAEIRRLAELARGAAAGRGALILIEGEPGIGKTALLRAALAGAAELFPRRMTAAAEEFDQRMPFATIRSCLQPLEAGDRRAAEILALIQGGSAEHPVTEAALALVEEWCAACPVALAIDDLHWADPASLLLLHRLGREAGQLPLLLAATIRGGTCRSDVDALTRSWRTHDGVRIMLGPLPDPAVTRLVTDLAGGQPGPVLRDLVDGAAGNPLYITELLSALARETRLYTEGARVDVKPSTAGQEVPPTLRLAVIRRLEFLSAGTRELLQVAALLGTTFSVADVAAVLDQPVTSLLDSVRQATEGGILVELPDRLAFRHPLVRTVLDDELPASAHQALHLQVAQALAARTSPERVAEHLLAAASAATPMVPWLASNADELAARTPELAAELLSRVLDTMVPPAGTARRLRAALATALLRDGRAEQAERVARSALTVPADPRTEAALRWTLASACFSQAAFDRAVAEIGIALAGDRLTEGERARFHALDAQCRIPLGQPSVAGAAWRDSVSAARASDDTEAFAYVMAGAAAACTWDGQLDEALGYAGASADVAEALGPRAARQLAPHLFRGVCLGELDRDAEAGRAYEDVARLAERGIGEDYLGWRANCVARLRFYQGRWDEALAEAEAGLDLPDPLNMARHLHGVIALIAVHRRDRAVLAVQLPPLHAPPPGPVVRRHSAHTPDLALALVAHAEGRTAEAAAILAATWDPDDDQDPLRFLRHYLVPPLVEFTLAAGHPDAARHIADSIGRYAGQRPSPSLRRSARHARALADQDGDGLAAVAEEYAEADRALFAAQARDQAAPLLAAAGRVPEARDALLGAVASYESMAASWDLSRNMTLLRTLGIRRGIRGPRRRPKAGWDALTAAETVIAGLVAEGLSNPAIAARLYLSRRTVQFHVSNILAKLGAASRVELAAMVIRHDAAAVTSR
jgi:DNA-binding CsgD family transcriptional regulator